MAHMARKAIFFGDGQIGEFSTWRWPKRDGVYRYRPSRSMSHLRLWESVQRGEPAHCRYQRGGHIVRFAVTAIPKPGLLECKHFELGDAV